MEAFKPSCNLLPLYAHFSRNWCSSLPFSHLELAHTLSLGQEQQANCIACLAYAFQEAEIQFFIPSSGLCAFLDPQLESIDLKDLSGDLKTILLNTLQTNIASVFSQWKISLTPKKVELWEEEKTCSNLVQCIITREDTPIYSLYINADNLSLNTFDSLFKSIEPANKGEGLVFPFTIERAQTHLLLREVKNLSLGDVLLVRDSQTYYKFRWKNFSFHADCKGQTITVKSLIMTDENNDLPAGIIPEENPPQPEEISDEVEETPQEEEVSEPVSITGQDALQTMPVTITFMAGEQTLSLEQVKQLHEGYTFELDKTPSDNLQILANGRCIGEGEWVQINEHLGVRITQLNLK